MTEKLWVRFGDCADYEEVTDEHIMSDIFDPSMIGDFVAWTQHGMITTFHKGANFISLFWAVDCSLPVRALSWIEKQYFEEMMYDNKS